MMNVRWALRALVLVGTAVARVLLLRILLSRLSGLARRVLSRLIRPIGRIVCPRLFPLFVGHVLLPW